MPRTFTATTSKSTTADVLRIHGHDPHRIAVAIRVFVEHGQRALDENDHLFASRMFAAICQHTVALEALKRKAH